MNMYKQSNSYHYDFIQYYAKLISLGLDFSEIFSLAFFVENNEVCGYWGMFGNYKGVF